MALAYEATYRTKRGSVLDRQFAETREEAARQLFARNPHCRVASISNATIDSYSGKLRSFGMDCRWINRADCPGVDGFRSDNGYLPDDVLA